MTRIVTVDGGYAINADSADPNTAKLVHEIIGDIPLIATDPPYGGIVSAKWDVLSDVDSFVGWMLDWTRAWSSVLLSGGAFYVWGGIGKPGLRPFFKYIPAVESSDMGLVMSNLITWKKKRAYGLQWNYLFTREELAYFVKGDPKKPRCFNVPYLEEKRGYAGYNKKYPALSEYYRRSNVWTDITEVMRGKVHDAQKAQRVVEVPIEVSTNPDEWVVDPFAGSGTTALAARALGRRFVVIEQDAAEFEKMLTRISVPAQDSVIQSDHERKPAKRSTGPRAKGRSRGLEAADQEVREVAVRGFVPEGAAHDADASKERQELGPAEEGQDGTPAHGSQARL